MSAPNFTLEVRRHRQPLLVFGFYDRGFVLAIWPLMVKLSLRCRP